MGFQEVKQRLKDRNLCDLRKEDIEYIAEQKALTWDNCTEIVDLDYFSVNTVGKDTYNTNSRLVSLFANIRAMKYDKNRSMLNDIANKNSRNSYLDSMSDASLRRMLSLLDSDARITNDEASNMIIFEILGTDSNKLTEDSIRSEVLKAVYTECAYRWLMK